MSMYTSNPSAFAGQRQDWGPLAVTDYESCPRFSERLPQVNNIESRRE